MKRNLFLFGLLLAVAITATLAIRKHFTYNHNRVSATAEVQPELVTTTQTSEEEPAPVAQVHGDSSATNVVEITFLPKFTYATSPVGKTISK